MVIPFKQDDADPKLAIAVNFHGFDIKCVTTLVSPNLSLRKFVEALIIRFKLEQTDSCGFVGYHVLSIGNTPNEILNYYDKNGNELSFASYGINNDSDVSLFYAPGTSAFLRIENTYSPITTDAIFEDDEFIIYLTIEGTSYEEVPIKITDPCITIRNQISSLVSEFDLPKLDNGGNPIQYLLGQIMEDGEESEILDFEDDEGREQALIDYNIQPGDHLYLLTVQISGSIWCNVIAVKTINFLFFRYQSLKIFKVQDYNGNVCRLYGSIEYHIKEMVAYLKLNKRKQYFLAKLNYQDNEIRFYFLNGNSSDGWQSRSIVEYEDILKSQGNEYTYLLLFPSSGLTNRTLKKLKEITEKIRNFPEI